MTEFVLNSFTVSLRFRSAPPGGLEKEQLMWPFRTILKEELTFSKVAVWPVISKQGNSRQAKINRAAFILSPQGFICC
jgi:hypothetical protein